MERKQPFSIMIFVYKIKKNQLKQIIQIILRI